MKFLKKLSEFQYNHSVGIILVVLLITLILGAGTTNISMQSDMSKMMPQELEIYRIADQIDDKFGGQDASIVLLKINGANRDGVYDIRDPRVIKFLVELEDSLEGEDLISGVQSIGMIFTESTIPQNLEMSKQIFSGVPVFDSFFNKDYSATIVLISSDLGGSEDKIKELEILINEKVSEISQPENVDIHITGNPQIRSMILDLLAKDAVYTILIAAIIIFILLILMEKSFTKALLVSVPLLFGITWTLGSMGWLGVKLSIATVGIGAMILGLGVEYGVFIVSRYSEERKNKTAKKSLTIAVQEVGSSILGSGSTTIMGFLALTLSIMPMLRDLGLSLAMGITFSLTAAVLVNPPIIILEEKFEEWSTQRKHKEVSKKLAKHEERRKLNENH